MNESEKYPQRKKKKTMEKAQTGTDINFIPLLSGH